MIVDDVLWKALLDLKSRPIVPNIFGWAYDGTSFIELKDSSFVKKDYHSLLIKTSEIAEAQSTLSSFCNVCIPFEELVFYVNKTTSIEVQTVLKNYWPLSVLGHIDMVIPYIFIHSAISLDGYLATNTGHSRWIGNEENLIHSHRLRALFDAILIGGNTVQNDEPSLNVRHVDGKNPKRLVISNKCEDLSALKKVMDCETYLLRDSAFEYDDDCKLFDKIIAFEGSTKKEKLLDLMKKCKTEQISSILIEGGGTTLSSFIETKLARIIQFHLSPLLFGSGIKAVKLPTVDLVDDTHKLRDMYVTQIGDSFMVTAGLE